MVLLLPTFAAAAAAAIVTSRLSPPTLQRLQPSVHHPLQIVARMPTPSTVLIVFFLHRPKVASTMSSHSTQQQQQLPLGSRKHRPVARSRACSNFPRLFRALTGQGRSLRTCDHSHHVSKPFFSCLR
jgi:hypothetical protein